jgi:type I restriction enzyme S subunit
MQSNSTGIRNLNILQFLDIKVPLPNLSKQHLIVEKLDHAFAEIDLLEENLELSNEKITELSESLLSASFEQGVIKPEQKNTQSIPDFNTIKNSVAFRLSEVTEMITDGSHNPPKGIEHSDYLMLSSRNVFNDSINLDKVRYLTKQDFDQEDKRTSLKDSDVLLTIVGTIGRSAVFNTSLGQITLQRSVAVIRPVKSKLNSRFLMYSLQSMLATLLSESRGVAQQGFYLDQLRNLNLVVPSLEEQHKVVETLDSVFANIERIRTQLAIKKDLAIMLRQSLLSDSFSPNLEKESV